MDTGGDNGGLLSEINVTPFVDVMLVLLIIFMVTAPMLNLGVEVNLPKADAEPLESQENEEPMVLTVLENGDVPLFLLEQQVDAYIDRAGRS